jgi:catechol 2,3-dioxygenase-like lactoylglutathione lyase family enzyme
MHGRTRLNEATPRGSRHDWWGVVLEAPDAQELARFYSALLDWPIDKSEPGFATIAPGEGVAYISFQTAPSYARPVWPSADGSQQIMMHLDVEVDDLDVAVAAAIELGAEQAEFQPQTDVRVMLDPAGHPFCLYVGS